ncbi:MAG: hypothetical protein ACP5NY_08320 [Thermocladium sp.]
MNLRELNDLIKAEMGRESLVKLPFKSYRELAASIGSSLRVGGALENALSGVYSSDAKSAIIALIRIRMEKILAAVRSGSTPKNLLVEEKRILNSLSYLEPLLPRSDYNGRVRIVSFGIQFLRIRTSNGNEMGPFRKGDVAVLPVEDAEDLMMRKIVSIIYRKEKVLKGD